MAQMENKSKVFVEKLGSWVSNKRSIERVEVDLSRVVAIGEPIGNDNSVNICTLRTPFGVLASVHTMKSFLFGVTYEM